MLFYFVMTAIHATHMIIGIGIMLVLIWMARRGKFSREYHNPVECFGLYWHFVDIVWVFLFPALYLIAESVMAENHDHIVSPRLYVSVLIALMVLLVLTLVAAFVDLDKLLHGGYWNMSLRDAHRHIQSGTDHPVFHAREIRQPADLGVCQRRLRLARPSPDVDIYRLRNPPRTQLSHHSRNIAPHREKPRYRNFTRTPFFAVNVARHQLLPVSLTSRTMPSTTLRLRL